MRLATTVAIAELHGLMNVEFRRNHEAEHQGAEAEAPHCSRPAWSFLRNLKAQSAPIRLWRINWCKYWHPAPQRAHEKADKLSTLAEDAILSTPDQLDRLSRRSDGLARTVVPLAKKHRGVCQQ